MIIALYIMSPSGIPIYYYDRMKKEDKITDAILFTGLITAIQNFMEATEVGEPEQFTTSTREIYLKTTSCFSVVLIKELNDTIQEVSVKKLLIDLARQIFDVIGTEEACNALDEIQGNIISDLSELVISEWEKEMKSTN